MRASLLAWIALLTSPITASCDSGARSGVVTAPQLEPGSQVFEERDRIWESALADLDADGDLDLVLTSLGSGTAVLLNDGRGHFAKTDQQFENGTHGIAIGDLDGDGDQDLFFALLREGSAIYANDGHARFRRTNTDLSLRASEIVRLADIDHDGDLDAYLWWRRELCINDGKGNFSKGSLELPNAQSFCDLDDDGAIDILTAERGSGFRVYRNDGAGGFAEHSFVPNASLTFCYTAFADVDHDGDLDVIFTNGTEKEKHPAGVLLNDGHGMLSDSGLRLSSVAYGFIGTGDLDNDGWIDLVFTGRDTPPRIWMNHGDGTFVDSGPSLGEGGNWNNCIIDDLDGDGDNDVFVTKVFGGSHGVYFNRLDKDRH